MYGSRVRSRSGKRRHSRSPHRECRQCCGIQHGARSKVSVGCSSEKVVAEAAWRNGRGRISRRRVRSVGAPFLAPFSSGRKRCCRPLRVLLLHARAPSWHAWLPFRTPRNPACLRPVLEDLPSKGALYRSDRRIRMAIPNTESRTERPSRGVV